MKSYIINSIAFLTMVLIISSCGEENSNSPIFSDVVRIPSESNENAGTENSYIVVLNDKSGTVLQGSADLITNDVCLSNSISLSKVNNKFNSLIAGFSATLNKNQVEKLRKDSRVKLVEEDKEVFIQGTVVDNAPNKVGSTLQGQLTPWGVSAVGGSVAANANTGVAWIIDTGIDLDHPDLNVNTTLSKTFVTRGSDATSADDGNGHGTHCAGIIAANDNSIGYVGVCAGAEVIAIKVLSYRGSGYTSDIISGLEYVGNNLVANKLNVVNMSLGSTVSSTLDEAVKKLAAKTNVKIVVAAGNNCADANKYSPARVEHSNVLTVSSCGSTGEFSKSFSNFNNAPIDFAAPGEYIYSTYKNGTYKAMSGTSMATPHVVGILLANSGTVNYKESVLNDKDTTPDKKAIR